MTVDDIGGGAADLLADPLGSPEQLPGPPPRWDLLDDQGTAAALAALRSWVAMLVDRYNLDNDVPPCWEAHGGAVEELAALHAAWLAAYDPLAQPADALSWHEHLGPALERITSRWCRGCTPREHRDRYRGVGATTGTDQ